MNSFEIAAPFVRNMAITAGLFLLALLLLASFKTLLYPATTVSAWVRYYWPYGGFFWLIFPAAWALKRQPRVWLDGDLLFARTAPARAITSIRIAHVPSQRVRRPLLRDYVLTGLVIKADGQRTVIPVASFSRAQLAALADAIESRTSASPDPTNGSPDSAS